MNKTHKKIFQRACYNRIWSWSPMPRFLTIESLGPCFSHSIGDHDQILQYTVGHLCTTFEEFIFNYVAIIAKIEFDLLLSVNNPSDVIVTKLKLNSMSFHLLDVCKKSSNWYLKACWEKSGKRGRSDGQTDGYCHRKIRPFFKRAYKRDNHSNSRC